MKRAKRWLFWVLLSIFAAGSLFWFFHVPYRPTKLFRMVPADALYVSHHRALAERWPAFSANPLVSTLLNAIGLDPDELDAWHDDPDTRRWLEKLLARDVLIAYVPGRGPLREPAWVVAGWIGGESIRLRWLLQRGRLEGFRHVPRQAGSHYWQVDLGPEAQGNLSVGLVEGMLVGVFSDDPHAARRILDVYDGLSPRHDLFEQQSVIAGVFYEADTLDRMWFLGPDGEGNLLPHVGLMDEVGPSLVDGRLIRADMGDWPALEVRSIEWPSRLLGGLPFAVLSAHPEVAYTLLSTRLPPVASRVYRGLYAVGMEGMVLMAALGDDYAGSWLGLRVPSLIAAWPVVDEAEAVTRMRDTVDQLNAEMRWGLILSPTDVAGRTMYTIESTSGTMYGRLNAANQAAFAMVEDWMVWSSHARPLRRLLERLDRPEALFEADAGGWQAALRDEPAMMRAYINHPAGAPIMRLTLSAYATKLLWDDPVGSRAMRQRLQDIRAWIDLLEPMENAHLALQREDGFSVLHVRLGEESADQ